MRRARGGEHYCGLSDDKVQQCTSSKVNALVRFKCNDLDSGTQFTCFTGTKVAEASKAENTVVRLGLLSLGQWNDLDSGSQFTCFTGTKVQTLTQVGEQRAGCK